MPTRAPLHHLLGAAGPPTGLASTAYDTAWLASVPDPSDATQPRFPTALQWLRDHQLADGSWGGAVRYEHDRVLSTLAALVPLATFGRGEPDGMRLANGTRYLWQHGHRLMGEPMELVAFELLLPALVARAQRAGILVPPHLDTYASQRVAKLRLIPRDALYTPGTTAVHSLEFLDEQADDAGLRAAQGLNGSIGNSPAATAFFLARTGDRGALGYLEGCLARQGGAATVLEPCETFERLWAAYHLYLAGVPAAQLLNGRQRRLLRRALTRGGVSLSPTTFPIPDADDTAVALLLLHELGEPVDPTVLQRFALPSGAFASFPHERHGSVGVNLHVLHALLRVPGYPDRERAVERLVDYVLDEQVRGLFWVDKWHVSPYYATAHALLVLAELPASLSQQVRRAVERAREWLHQTQNADGSWGFYDRPTVEETAYGVLTLAAGRRPMTADRQRCSAGMHFLSTVLMQARPDQEEALFPALWIDKCLYAPTLVVRAVLEAASIAYGLHARQDRFARGAA